MQKILGKIFTFKGNRQFSESENRLIDTLNDIEDFIADEAFIDYRNQYLFAFDKELKKLLKISLKEGIIDTEILGFDNVEQYTISIKDRAGENWMENYNKWKKQKKFIQSIVISFTTNEGNTVDFPFFESEIGTGDRVASIPVKRAFFSLEKWDLYLQEYIKKEIDE